MEVRSRASSAVGFGSWCERYASQTLGILRVSFGWSVCVMVELLSTAEVGPWRRRGQSTRSGDGMGAAVLVCRVVVWEVCRPGGFLGRPRIKSSSRL